MDKKYVLWLKEMRNYVLLNNYCCMFISQAFSFLQQLAGQASCWIFFQLSHEEASKKIRIGKDCENITNYNVKFIK